MRPLRDYLLVSHLTLLAALALVGCSAPGVLAPPPAVELGVPQIEEAQVDYELHGLPGSREPLLTADLAVLARLRAAHQAWAGTPYRFGGTGRNGIDCSAFVQRVFHEAFDHRLTRSTGTQVHEGEPVRRDELQPGDLVFFRTGQRQRHVGIYLHSGRFLHASSRSGVTVDRIDDGFYDRTFWTARRVMPPELRAALVEPTAAPPIRVAAERAPAGTPERPAPAAAPERPAPAWSPGTTEAPAGASGNEARRSGW